MGLTLQFIVGKKQQILSATEAFDLDFFEAQESEGNVADFSLHIIPDDLGLLIQIACSTVSSRSIDFRESLDTTQFYFDSEEWGAYNVSPIVGATLAGLDKTKAEEAVERWASKMSGIYKEELAPTSQTVDALLKLIEISKKAQTHNLDLVHFWCL